MINKILSKIFGTRVSLRTVSGATLKAPLKSERDFDVAMEWLAAEYYRRGYGTIHIVQADLSRKAGRELTSSHSAYDFDLFR